tara:strand:+ start:319 stop:573 length:255 start_codon:yes stop_codon:yes gene_type:complete
VLEDKIELKVGDIVTEVELIVPDERERWNGIVLSVEEGAFVLSTLLGAETQDRVIVLWLDNALTEELPASVLILLHRAEDEETD